MNIDIQNNIILSNLTKSELNDLLKKINKDPLLFRKKLNLPVFVSFGVEIEGDGLTEDYVEEIIDNFNYDNALLQEEYYSLSQDYTVDFEVISPILTNTAFNWNYFKRVYQLLRKTGAVISYYNAGHVHFGTHFIDNPATLSWLIKTLVAFEDIIHLFGYGYSDKPRTCIVAHQNKYIYSIIMSPKKVKYLLDMLDKYNLSLNDDFMLNFFDFSINNFSFLSAFNFSNFNIYKFKDSNQKKCINEYDHMEIRCFNGTLDPEIAQNNINLGASMLLSVYNDKIDKEYIENEYQKFISRDYDFSLKLIKSSEEECKKYNNILNSFSEKNIDKAIKLADMIFETTTDKKYFLKQYLKLFNRSDEYVLKLIK